MQCLISPSAHLAMARAGGTLILEHTGRHMVPEGAGEGLSQEGTKELVCLRKITEMTKGVPQASLNSKGSQGAI